MLLVVAFDIADDRRRVRLHTVLLGFGTAIQESVVECEVTPTQSRTLKRRLARIVRQGFDRVNSYPRCAHCAAGWTDAAGRRPSEPPAFVI